MTDLASGPLWGLPLADAWFALLFAMLGAFLFLDGFDFGAGALFATRDDPEERDTILAAIGPFWDGNEVWLVVFGGALFAAFPAAYAGLFSRNYVLMFAILLALLFRGLAPEMYEQRHDDTWQTWWGRAFVVGSVAAPFLLGIFVANWLTGTDGFLSVAGVLVGLTVVALTVVSGTAFVRLKTETEMAADVRPYGERALAAYLGLVLASLAALALTTPALEAAIVSLPVAGLVVLSVLLAAGYVVALRRDQDLLALAASGLLTFGLVAVVATLLYPTVDPAADLTVQEGIVEPLTLNLMTIASTVLLPLVLSYFVVLYNAFSGPIEAGEAY
jgi:cytochrome d ubiquinol oxidase subunit II